MTDIYESLFNSLDDEDRAALKNGMLSLNYDDSVINGWFEHEMMNYKENSGTGFSEFLRKKLSEKDSRFDLKDKSTWIQNKKNEAQLAGAAFAEDYVKEEIERQKRALDAGIGGGEYIPVQNLKKNLEDVNKVNKKYGNMGYRQIDYSVIEQNQELQGLLKQALAHNRGIFQQKLEEPWKSMKYAESGTAQYYAGQDMAWDSGTIPPNLGLSKEKELADQIKAQNDLIEKQNILKKAGVEITDENLKKYEDLIKQEQERIKIQHQMKQINAGATTLMNAQDRLLRMRGQDRQADYLKLAREQIAAQGGKGLTGEQEEEINARLDLTNALSRLDQLQLKENLVMTNDLTSRGGMVGGAYVEDNFNKSVLERLNQLALIEPLISREAQCVANLQRDVTGIHKSLQIN